VNVRLQSIGCSAFFLKIALAEVNENLPYVNHVTVNIQATVYVLIALAEVNENLPYVNHVTVNIQATVYVLHGGRRLIHSYPNSYII